jgi:tetratricopeptide (TPR) repeat protein
VHEELARWLEARNDFAGAAEQYRIAFGLKPDKRKFLLDIARVEQEALRWDYAMAAWLAASRGPGAWVAEQAREFMPARYPFVYEFEYAIQMDPLNVAVRRELGFLLLKMNREREALAVFQDLLRLAPEDELSLAQVAFLKGSREMLTRVAAQGESSLSAVRELAERSLEKGYLKDALEYLNQVQKANPDDYQAMLRLGWTHNMLKNDREAVRWFALARRSPDEKIAAEAEQAYRNLQPSLAPFRTTTWVLPFYSSRWREVFTYGQTKMEFRLPGTTLRPYISSRLIADLGRNRALQAGPGGALGPQALSEGAVVGAAGLATARSHGWMAWGEAGTAWRYFSGRDGGAKMKPDYRGGVNFARTLGERGLWATTFDGVFLSRFDNNALFYWQNRIGQTKADKPVRFYWNANITVDAKRQDWANFIETGPGLRFHFEPMPKGLYFSVDYLEGWHLMETAPGRARRFRDLRAGLWYAFTR